LFAADASKVVDETLCTNKMLEIVQFLEEKGSRNSLRTLVRFKLSTLLEDTEYSMNGYDADVVMEKAIALWADENPMPTGAADKKIILLLWLSKRCRASTRLTQGWHLILQL
jgi:hypothetical protein